MSKLKTFIHTCDSLVWRHTGEIDTAKLLEELITQHNFTKDEVAFYIDKAKNNGQIYERREGVLARV